jgi:CRP-like cAMP-binding protein
METVVENRLRTAYREATGSDLPVKLEPVPLPFKSVLFQPEQRPRYVHLLTSGLSSQLALLAGGSEVEVAAIGTEGFPEAIYLLGPAPPIRQCIMQVPGTALRLPFGDFERLFQEDATLRSITLRAVQYQSLQQSQLAACNGQHDAEERLARWLLMVQDQIQSEVLPLTQEFLGQMLGARRSTITIAAGALQRSGIIEYRWGQIRVKDRKLLEDAACECYGVIRALRESLYA